MSVKECNKRVSITLTPNQIVLLKTIMNVKKIKTYGKAIEYVLGDYLIALETFWKYIR